MIITYLFHKEMSLLKCLECLECPSAQVFECPSAFRGLKSPSALSAPVPQRPRCQSARVPLECLEYLEFLSAL